VISPDLSGKDPNAKDCDADVPVEKATACGFGTIFSIAPSTVTPGLIWIGTDNGKIQLTRNEGKSWTDVTPSAIADWSKIVSIDASPIDSASAYVAVDRHRRDDWHPYIYRTHDSGKNWTSITSGLPENSYVTAVRQDPHKKDLLYAGTRTGVFVSLDDGDHWQPLQLNLPRSGINDLLVHDDDLIVATQGRAIWVLDNISPLRHVTSTLQTTLFSPAKAYRISKNENRDTPLPPEMPTAQNPPAGVMIDYLLSGAPAEPLKLEILNGKGEILRTFTSADQPQRAQATQYFADRWLKPLQVLPAQQGHNRFVWDLRLEQPKVPEYDFSIAAVPGVDTSTTPQGIMILPGKYSVRLTVDGKAFTQPFLVEKDPRSKVKVQDLDAEFALYKQTSELAAANVQKYKQLKKEDAKKNADFISAMDALTGLIKDLEDADGPPTGPQKELFEETMKILR
jgi:hypothetical protein